MNYICHCCKGISNRLKTCVYNKMSMFQERELAKNNPTPIHLKETKSQLKIRGRETKTEKIYTHT